MRIFILLCLVIFSGCISTISYDVKSTEILYPASVLHPLNTERVQGYVKIGMTKEEVLNEVGKPSRKYIKPDDEEVWIYGGFGRQYKTTIKFENSIVVNINVKGINRSSLSYKALEVISVIP